MDTQKATERIELTRASESRTGVWVRHASGAGSYLGSVVFTGYRYVASCEDVRLDDFDTRIMAIKCITNRTGYGYLAIPEAA